MKRYLFSCLYFFLSAYNTQAQSIENSINLYGINFPQEKIHIHFDKELYLPGETIWFKAYIFEENLPSERSTNFYASLYDEEGHLLQSQLSPIFNSSTDGHFDIPDSLSGKQLICRAYTSWMLNFDTTFLFTQAIKLINKDVKEENTNTVKTTSLNFYPEGGDIIEGTSNTIAFKANYNNGLPFEINGVLKKQETGEVVMPLKSQHDGMGRFDIEIQPGEKYYAEWTDNNGATQQTYLPTAKPEGVSLKLVLQKDKLIYNITNKLPNDSLHILMYMYQKVFYKTDLLVTSAIPYTGFVPTTSLPTGVMQLTVFNKNWQAVAERVAFINNDNYTAGITISNKETSIQKRGKNVIEITAADTMTANMSLSITDADLNNEETNNTIVSNLLLSGDVKGYIHNPAYYFANNTDAGLKTNLDLVMLTHGWRRYNWDAMLVQKMPEIYHSADNYLSVYGQVSQEVMAKISKEENINLVVKTRDSTNNFYSVWPDSTGLLKQQGLIFYDTAKVLFSFNKNKLWNTQMAFSKSNYTLNQPYAIADYRQYLLRDTTGTTLNKSSVSLYDNYIRNKNGVAFGSEKTLEGVVVKSNSLRNWKNNPAFKLDQKYTSGLFRSSNSYSFDVMNDEMAAAKFDIYNYLFGKVPGLTVKNSGGGKSFVINRGNETLPVLLFIDERIVDNDQLGLLNMEDIAYVKYVDFYVGERNSAGTYGPALSIYYKKGDDRIDRRPKATDMQFFEVPGYSPIKEFYSPDYSKNNTSAGADARTTLLWLPYIITDAATRKIPVTFYNNDFSKKLRVVLEGINAAGKMVHIEKIIE